MLFLQYSILNLGLLLAPKNVDSHMPCEIKQRFVVNLIISFTMVDTVLLYHTLSEKIISYFVGIAPAMYTGQVLRERAGITNLSLA